MARARSAAEMPVVMPWAASTETVNAVLSASVLRWLICGRSSRSACSAEIGAQIRPRPWVAMKAMLSLVTLLAAQIRSASFSRVGSSAQMIIFPAAMSAMISSIGLKVSELMFLKPRVRPNAVN